MAEAVPEAEAEAAPSDAERRARRPSRLRRYAIDAMLVVGVYVGISAWQERNLVDTGAPAADFALTTLAGEPVRLEDFRGKRVLLHFWATWCGVCQREYGALRAVQAGLDDDEVLLSIVADGENRAAIEEIIERESLDYPVLLGTDDVIEAFRIGAFPTNYFIDERGRITDHTVGMSTRWGLAWRLGG